MPLPAFEEWVIPPRDRQFEQQMAQAVGIHPLMAAVLHNRGLTTEPAIRDFLQPSLDRLHDPSSLPDIDPAVARLVRAVDNREHVLVHGDYDVDGITACALMTRFLSTVGVQVSYYIPHRIKDQYGLSPQAVRQATEKGIKLIVAVDCGVTAHEAIAAARSGGADVIVIDHHEPGPQLPEGALIIDPKRSDSQYPESELAAVGLCFKVASAACQALDVSQTSLQRAFLDLVALGTVADMVPLRGENRLMAAAGLKLLPQTRKVGLAALLNICGLDSQITARDVSYRIAPRLNAVGRLADANEAVDLLLTDDQVEADRLVNYLDSLNRERRAEQERVYQEAQEMIDESEELQQAPALVLDSEGWHIGVVGIVASHLLERYRRPAMVLVHEGDQARGSARSVEGFDIAEALQSCSDLLVKHGGHAAAAGLAIQRENLPAFRQRMNDLVVEALGPDGWQERLRADAVVDLAEIDGSLLEDLQALEPCGQDNPQPRFVSRDVEVSSCRRVGAQERHLKLQVNSEKGYWDCIGFGLAKAGGWIQPGQRIDICFTPEFNEYMGARELQLRLESVRPGNGETRRQE